MSLRPVWCAPATSGPASARPFVALGDRFRLDYSTSACLRNSHKSSILSSAQCRRHCGLENEAFERCKPHWPGLPWAAWIRLPGSWIHVCDGGVKMEAEWFDLVIATALPLAFLVQLLWSEVSFARRGVELGGKPPIDRRLFTRFQVPGDRDLACSSAAELGHRMAAVRRFPDAAQSVRRPLGLRVRPPVPRSHQPGRVISGSACPAKPHASTATARTDSPGTRCTPASTSR